ncbi:unnamed protein product [Penicillium pancosmium]
MASLENGYIRSLDAQEQDAINFLSEDFEDEGRYQSIRNPIANTWLVSFQNLVKQNSLAGDFLSLMACINTLDIPIAFLPRPSQLELERAIGALSSYSFIKVRTTNNLIDMHRLEQLAMRNWLNHLNRLSGWQICAAILLVNHAQDINGAEITHLQARRALIPHAIYLLESTTDNHEDYIWSELTLFVSGCLYESGRISEATRYCLEVVDITEKLGRDECTVTRNKALLSRMKSAQEEYEEAEIMAMKALQSSEKSENISSTMWPIPPQHTRLYHDNGTILYIRTGRLVNAKELTQQQVIILTKLHGPDHPLILSTRSTQARIYYGMWKLKEAAELDEKVFQQFCKVSGPEHQQTLGAMCYLSVT